MNKVKKIISILLTVALFACALILLCSCDPYVNVHVNGVYAVVDTSSNTATVCGFDKDESVGPYDAQVCYVPETLTYNGDNYTVTGLFQDGSHSNPFVVNGHVKRLVIPQTVTYIDLFSFTMSDTFDYLEEIEVRTDNPNYASLDGVLYSKDCATLIMYPPAKRSTTMYIRSEVTQVYESHWNYCNKYVEKVSVEAGNTVFSEADGVLLSNGGTRLEYVPYAHDSVLELPNGVQQIARWSLRYANVEHLYLPASVYNVEYGDNVMYNPLRYVAHLYFEQEQPLCIAGLSKYLNEVNCGVTREDFRQLTKQSTAAE